MDANIRQADMFATFVSTGETTPDGIPEYVIAGLAVVREWGAVNMGDQAGVLDQLWLHGWPQAGTWLRDHEAQYMDALHHMGLRVTKGRGSR